MSQPKDVSQYDYGLALRLAHQDENKAIRVTSANTSVPPLYSRVELTYDSNGSVTNALFYKGETAETREIEFIGDSLSSLSGKWFPLYSEYDESAYYIWYNVNGTGIDPSPAGLVGIEIPLNSNDSASVVKLATRLYLERFTDFKVKDLGNNKLRVTNSRYGTATNTTDLGSTGFTFLTTVEGSENLIKSIDIPSDSNVRYVFNEQEKKFEIFPSNEVTVTTEVDLQNPNSYEIINLAVANKNVEVSQVLPDDTKRYTISVRDARANLRLASVSGETTTNYRTIYRGNTWESKDTDIPNGTTLYLMSTQDNITIEIEVWRRV